jgi:acetoacetyl-CoA synthetase
MPPDQSLQAPARIDDDPLTAAYKRTLERESIEENDDFFELGGSSMSAISLVLEIERLTGRELPIASVYEAPTIAAMRSLLSANAAAGGSSPSLLVLMRDGTRSQPLFLVHGIGGSILELHDLVSAMGGERAIYGIQAAGLDGSPPNSDVKTMASLYVDQIREVQPAGPYLVIGYSVGGLIAFEMARLLTASGSKVGVLGLIDTYLPENGLLHRFRRHARRLSRTSPSAMLPELLRLAHHLRFRLRVIAGLSVRDDIEDLPLPRAYLDVRLMGRVALQTYRASACPIDIVFFQAVYSRLPEAGDPVSMWQPFVRSMTLEHAEADHGSLIKTGAVELARAIDRHLARAGD